jgi:phosphatidylinositol dimannoside acyltransferase
MQNPAEFASYLGYSMGWQAVRRMPRRLAYGTFSKLADQLWRQKGAGVQQLERNLERVQPDVAHRQLRELSRAGMQSYFRYWCDVFRLPDWSHSEITTAIDFDRPHLLQDTVDSGTGCVVALSHSGNWDLCGAYGSLTFSPVVSVAENLKPERLTTKFHAFREELGMEIITLRKGEDVFGQLVEKVKEGKIIALLGDRDLTSSGVPVDFFGETTRMPAGPAALALDTGAPLMVATVSYTPDQVRFRLTDPVTVSAASDHVQAIRETTQTIATELERGIAQHPEDWHMLQRLWLADLDQSRLKASRYD